LFPNIFIAMNENTHRSVLVSGFGSKSFSLKHELTKIWRPERFQGSRKTDTYFEGWYFKNVSSDSQHCWSFIPGISLAGENSHAFVQAINGKTGETSYFRFDIRSFSYSTNSFRIQIGPNEFSTEGFTLDLDNGEEKFKGKVAISNIEPFKVNVFRPGIMGWYRYVPFMECYHGVVSLDHQLNGTTFHNQKAMNFDNGIGYIEKDWGTSMPKAWVWMHCNHFEEPGVSFMISVARIPWLGRTFTGFLGFFLHNGETHVFATYTGAKINALDIEPDKVNIQIETKKLIIDLKAANKSKGALKAPVHGDMERIIHESIDAKIELKVSDKKHIVFQGLGRNAGLELVGNKELLK